MSRAADWASNAVLQSIIRLAMRLPYETRIRFFGFMSGYVVAPVAGYISKGAANLRYIFEDMPPAEARRVARVVAVNAGKNLIENYSKDDLAARMKDTPVTGEGLAAFHEAVAAGRPVLMVSGHLGNYETVRVAVYNMGLQSCAIYRPARNPYFERHYGETIASLSGPSFPQTRRGIVGFSKYLRDGGIAGILFDVRASHYGDVDFMGKPAPTSTFPAEIALKTNALLLPCFSRRGEDGFTHHVTFEAPVAHGTPMEMTEEISRRLGARVRERPEQWLWLHDRWGSPDLRAKRQGQKEDAA